MNHIFDAFLESRVLEISIEEKTSDLCEGETLDFCLTVEGEEMLFIAKVKSIKPAPKHMEIICLELVLPSELN